MKPENSRLEKKHINNATLAKTEMWLHEQARTGWKLSDVKDGPLFTTFHFIKCKPCDYVYFAPASFVKSPSYTDTSISVIHYIKSRYGGKKVSNKTFCSWIRVSKGKITDLQDVKKNLLYRENCIAKDYLLYFLGFAVLSLSMFAIGIIGLLPPIFYILPSLIGIAALIHLIKLIVHNRNCRKIYTNFLE